MNAVVQFEIQCPYCWEPVELSVDTTQGSFETIEDCQVCCRPMRIIAECEPGDVIWCHAEPC